MFDTLSRITQLRSAHGWSTYKLSKLSGIPQSTIATWYQKNLCPPIDKIELICNAFGISLSEFFFTAETVHIQTETENLLNLWSCLTREQQELLKKLMKELSAHS